MVPPFRRLRFRKVAAMLCLLSFSLSLWIGPLPISAFTVQASEPHVLVQTGVEQYQAGEFQSAIMTWKQALPMIADDRPSHRTIILENLARAHRQIGAFSTEIGYWEQALQAYQQQGERQALGRVLTEQAQAYSRLGQHRRGMALLCGEDPNACEEGSAIQIAQAMNDTWGEVAALGSLGEAYRLTGNYTKAVDVLETSLTLLENNSSGPNSPAPTYQAAILNSLGSTYATLAQVSTRRAEAAAERNDNRSARRLTEKAHARIEKAMELLQRSYSVADSLEQIALQVRSQLSLIPLYHQTDQPEAATQIWISTHQMVDKLPDSQDKVFASLALADTLEAARHRRHCPATTVISQQTDLIEAAIATAQTIQNARATSFGLGQLGHLHERCGAYDKALPLTQDAILSATKDPLANDSLYLWIWQQARILKAQGKPDEASKAYTEALAVLETLRSDILNSNQELQFDFRDRVEPIYREFATLKLAEVPPSVPITGGETSSIDSVLVTLDSLKLAELQNYFANDCVIVAGEKRVDVVGEQSGTAVISTAIFENRTAIIASFPDGQRQVEWFDIDQKALLADVNELRNSIEQIRFRIMTRYKAPASRLYDQLVRPFEAKLKDLQVNTLVFVNDGILRSLPMAVLYDGEQFLIEKFAIATTPSLTLTDPNTLKRQGLNALILGLSEASQVRDIRFAALGKVEEEITNVKEQFPGSTILKNADFSAKNLQQALQKNNYRILHIATHGSFGAEPEDNYIVTGEKKDDQTNKALTISQLDALVRDVSTIDQAPIDLLTLTACETAVGDDRATLGLAGVAVRAGVKSAIASLWAVDDEATANLITRFYHHLAEANLSKAEALRAAQLEVIQDGGFTEHPYYWAPFILIGNWL